MNQVVRDIAADQAADFGEFFAPASTDMVDGLVARYDAQRAKIEAFHASYRRDSLGGIISYFCRRREDKVPDFDLDIAICALNSDYWKEALALTDVYDTMPQKRREQWNEQLRAWQEPRYKKGQNPALDLPDFTDEVVRATLGDLLAQRGKFFAERVDGIFRELSKSHVTNTPQGFSKRMIIDRILSYGSPDWQRCGYINDLRCIIAKFMGREEPHHRATDPVVKAAVRNHGEWMSIDGGALRIRVYNGVGTAHLEVHPDMAWRLNAILASLYPAAIPESFRRKPVKAKKIKDFVLFDRPLPFAVMSALSSMEDAKEYIPDAGWNENKYRRIHSAVELPISREYDKHLIAEVDRVMAAIGATKLSKPKVGFYYQFDYDYRPVLDEVICSGCIPDHKSHQFYPTPEKLARIAVEMAGIQPGHNCLEPSAGLGALADLVPDSANVICYEISQLHCKALEAKGYKTVGGIAGRQVRCLDFLKLAAEYRGGGYDRIIMNPPFSEGRWKLHTEGAAKCVAADGVIVAILPASAKGNFDLPGFALEWSPVFDNEFAGTSISVVILKASKL
jgi:hypothetical protein